MATTGSHLEETAEDEIEHRPMMWLLLVTLVVLQFGYPVTYEGTAWTLVYLLTYIGIVVFSIRRANADRRRYWPLLIASLGLIVGTTDPPSSSWRRKATRLSAAVCSSRS